MAIIINQRYYDKKNAITKLSAKQLMCRDLMQDLLVIKGHINWSSKLILSHKNNENAKNFAKMKLCIAFELPLYLMMSTFKC